MVRRAWTGRAVAVTSRRRPRGPGRRKIGQRASRRRRVPAGDVGAETRSGSGRPVRREQIDGHAAFLPDQDGPLAVGGQPRLDGVVVRLVRLVGIPGAHQDRFGGSHASTRPVPSQPLAKKRARNSPPTRRSPSTSPSQRARRAVSSADHRSSTCVSKRSSMRTMPVPSAARRLPRIAATAPDVARHSMLLRSRFPGPLPRAGRPTVLPTGPGMEPAIDRAPPAARGGDRRRAAGPPGERRQDPPPATPAVPRHARTGDRQQCASSPAVAGPPANASSNVRRLSSESARTMASMGRLYQCGYVTVKVHVRSRPRSSARPTPTTEVVVPEQPGGDGPPWPPGLTERLHLDRIGPMPDALDLADRRREGDVADRPHVGPPEHHQQIDRRRPRPDAGDRLERGVDRIVIEARQPIEVEGARSDGGSRGLGRSGPSGG